MNKLTLLALTLASATALATLPALAEGSDATHMETRAVREFLPDVPVRSYVFTGHPSAYIVKPATAEAGC